MGYRSEVKMIFTGVDFDVATYQASWLAKIKDMKVPSDANWHDAGCPLFDSDSSDVGVLTLKEGRGEWLFEFDSVKWYDSYPVVQEYIKLLEGTPEHIHAEFIRIGEDSDDSEFECYGDDSADIEFYIARSIERN